MSHRPRPITSSKLVPARARLPQPLLASGARLDAIEVDRDLARELPGRVQTERCTVHCADALAFDFSSLAVPGEKLRLVGNLPYNISTPLLFHFLQYGATWRDLHVMLQKEVGERIAAEPGNKIYGRLTVALALRCRIERLFGISPGSFNPPPQVDSVFLRLVPHPVPLADTGILSVADRLVAAAFGMRRKRLSNGLREPGDSGGNQRQRHRPRTAARATVARRLAATQQICRRREARTCQAPEPSPRMVRTMTANTSTTSLKITVETHYLADQSEPESERYVFAYTITIQNTGVVPARLLDRHWIITDANGKVQQVRGDGVVGEQPTIMPGQRHRYSSGAVIETPVGTMEGSYGMCSDDGAQFRADIPCFRLAVPGVLH